MKWLCCCCCCERCCWPSLKENAVDDVTVLVPDSQPSHVVQTVSQPLEFFVPRRHSSYTAGSIAPVFVQPGGLNSDSCSSSGEEDGPLERGRSWSETNPSDVSPFSKPRSQSLSPFTSEISSRIPFGRHILTEIAELESSQDLTSPESETRIDAETYGSLTFSTKYDDQEQKLNVFVERASELPRKGTLDSYDTFVKIVVTSSRKTPVLSKAVKSSLNPVYEEEFVIPVSRTKTSRSNCLRLSVFDCDRQGRHDAVGHTTLLMSKINPQTVQKHCLPITPMSLPVSNLGQILMGLSYSGAHSRLSVHVIKGRHLRLDPEVYKRHFRPLSRDAVDTFVKVTLMCGGQKVKTTRSRVVAETPDPAYNHKCNFVVPPQFLWDSSVVVAIMVRAVLGRSAALGRVTSGPYTAFHSGTLTHWGLMLQDTRSVTRWRNMYL